MAVVNLFNEQWYLNKYPDVAQAVEQGLTTAQEHFQLMGQNEGRSPGPLFDPQHYLSQYPDVAAAVEAGLITAYEHFTQYGATESRSPVSFFDVDFYLQQNPDIAAAVEQGLISATEHFLQYGQGEPRAISPFFDLGAYISANPDISDAVSTGLINPLEHLLTYGFSEGRELGNGVSLAQFQNDPQFQGAIANGGDVFSALARVAEVAPFLQTFQPPANWAPPANTPIPTDFVPPPGTTLVIPPSVVVPPDTELPHTFEPVTPTPEPPAPPAPGPGPSPATFFASVSDEGGVPTVSFSGTATGNISVSIVDGVATFTRAGVKAEQTVELDADDLVNISVATGQKLLVAGGELDGLNVNFTGSGVVDITGVELTPSKVEGGVSNFASVSSVLYKVLLPNASARVNEAEDSPLITLNGTEADFIKACWIYFDRQYYDGWPETWVDRYYNLELSQAKADLALLYIDYLEEGGDAAPFLEFVAKTAVSGEQQTRSQWIHDNILGEVSAASLNDRFNGVDRQELREHYFESAGDFTDRPWVSGNLSDLYNANHKLALAFDYAEGWERADYIHYPETDTLDALAVEGEVEMWMGDGNSITKFTLARHEGAGIELALKAKERGGGSIFEPTVKDGIVVYEADAGASSKDAGWGTPAAWSLDFSIVTSLNGTSTTLDDFEFSLFIDVDPSAEQDLIEFHLLKPDETIFVSGGVEYDPLRSWVQMTPGGEYAVDEGGKPKGGFDYALEKDISVNEVVSQNSVNFGFDFLRTLLAENHYVNPKGKGEQDEGFGPGIFDFIMRAYDETGLLIENHIQIEVVGDDVPT